MQQPITTCPRLRRLSLPSIVICWLTVTCLAIAGLWNYSAGAGRSALAPSHLEPTAQTTFDAGKQYTLVVLLHPRCPCSRATINELAQLLAHTDGRLAVTVWIARPEGAPVDWEKADLWDAAAELPGVSVRADIDGSECKRFDAATSGQTLLYSPDGQLLFAGGITAARGHNGDNAGRSAIESIINAPQAAAYHSTSVPINTPVYGCPILNSPPHFVPAGNTSCQK